MEKILKGLQDWDIEEGDYDLLLKIEAKQRELDSESIPGVDINMSLGRFLVEAYTIGSGKSKADVPKINANCVECNVRLKTIVPVDPENENDE